MEKDRKMEFSAWLRLFSDCLKNSHKYNGPIDPDEIKEDYYQSFDDPEVAADEFYIEENRQD